MDNIDSFDNWTKQGLVKELKRHCLGTTGSKNTLVQRLRNFYREMSEATNANPKADWSRKSSKEEELQALELELKLLQTREAIRNTEFRLTQPPIGSTSMGCGSSEVAKTLQRSAELNQLPNVKAKVFNGNPLDYPDWKANFHLRVERKEFLTSEEKLMYLREYLDGPALECVSGYLLLTSEDAYQEAIEILEERFGNKFVISDAFLDKLEAWPKISSKDAKALRSYSDFAKQCNLAMKTIPEMQMLNDCRTLKRLVKVLPDHLMQRWSRHAGKYKLERDAYPPFKEYTDFLITEAELACDPMTGLQSLRGDSEPKQKSQDSKISFTRKAHTHACQSIMQPTQNAPFCEYCQRNSHETSECRKIQKLTTADQQTYMKENKLCFGCLKKGHALSDCTPRKTCKICNKEHATCLHKTNFKSSQKNDESTQKTKNQEITSSVTSNRITADTQHKMTSMIIPVYISTEQDPSTEIMSYALIDSQSDTSFIDQHLSSQLQGDRTKTQLRISTMTSQHTITECDRFQNLKIRGIFSDQKIVIPETYTTESIPADKEHIPVPETAAAWPHLRHLSNKIAPLQSCSVSLLIGYNCSAASMPLEKVTAHVTAPYAVKTILGWTVIGRGGPQLPNEFVSTNRIRTQELSNSQILNSLQEDLRVDHNDQKVSQNDIFFVEKMKENIRQIDGFYTMPLPFKAKPILPDNRLHALKRFRNLEQRLNSNEEFSHKYSEFMTEIISKGEAELVTDLTQPGWYIPHHGVYHPAKPGKLRVVFDCSSTYKGESLNKHLLQGPDMNNSLVGVLLRFRKESVAVMCDIKKMFHQFRVFPEDRDYLRFLWYKDSTNETVEDYHMNVHLFGASSSPSCAIFGLKQLAVDNKTDFPKAAEFVQNNFYVDDGLISLPTPTDAIQIMVETKKMCAKGNLILHSFVSNNKAVRESLGTMQSSSNKEINADKTIERALGLTWNTMTDEFQFFWKPMNKPATRRGILSIVSSLYDPMGFIAPVVLRGKQLLQRMCQENNNWDDPVSEKLQEEWYIWQQDLEALENVKISRCIKDENLSNVSCVELHSFSDASLAGYGACCYLKVVDESSNVCVNLVMAKSRVSPQKVITIPRLELQAAVLSVQVSDFVLSEMKYTEVDITAHFWTDSTTVLGYIANDARRFHTFVSNRIQRIKDSTTVEQWHYVPTTENPADLVSRGVSVDSLSEFWFKGPLFLSNVELEYVQPNPPNAVVEADDPEIKKVFCQAQSTCDTKPFIRSFDSIGSWDMLRKVVCLILNATRKNKLSMTDEIVTNTIIKLLQKDFSSEKEKLADGKPVSKKSPLYQLDPFVDETGILRVGGRLEKSSMTFDVKHPVILPNEYLSRLLILHCHIQVAHQGRTSTVNAIRAKGFHIIGGLRLVSSTIDKCVQCKRLRGMPRMQKMAALPKPRLEATPPFTCVGFDCFGPFSVKDGRKESKRYGLILTCLASRAVHLEMLDDLSTDGFINGLRNFISIRGPVKELISDNGSNFVGANNEMRKNLSELDDDRLKLFLERNQCKFVFNVPDASHMGGVWERLIRTVRNVLQGILIERNSSRLDSTSLRTLLYECMSIVNNRPITTANSIKATEPLPLTPNHLLTMKNDAPLPPPGSFDEPDLYCRKRWRRVQHLAELFWSRWKREYLQTLQSRSKWYKPTRNAKVDDIVLIVNDNLPRNQWQLARVIKVHLSSDGLVRSATVRVGSRSWQKGSLPQILDRPITKLVTLVPCD